jgi:hypothetical protein
MRPKANHRIHAALVRWSAGPLATIFLIFCVSGCDKSLAGSGSHASRHQFDFIPDGLLTPSSKKIDFGRVPQRGKRGATFDLTNSSPERVEVANISSSCPCVGVDLETRVVETSQRVEGRINLDLNKEQEFIGFLMIEVEGRTIAQKLAFALVAQVRVVEAE